jgi:hypothetical protein
MFKFLRKPYPFNDDLKHNAKVILLISMIVLIFLFLFQPYNLGELPLKDKIYLSIGIVVITFISLSLSLLILPSILPKMFNSSTWNIRKEIFWDLWLLLIISSGNVLLFSYFGIMDFELDLILTIILYGLIPISVLITLNQDRLLRSNLKSALDLNKKLQERKEIDSQMVFFESDYMKDSLSIKVNSLLFIRSANNYIEVFWIDSDKIQNQLVRSSLKKAEEILKDYKFIAKCHRSYIVNINHIDKIIGSYQGYKLSFQNSDIIIPVSQNYISKFKEII